MKKIITILISGMLACLGLLPVVAEESTARTYVFQSPVVGDSSGNLYSLGLLEGTIDGWHVRTGSAPSGSTAKYYLIYYHWVGQAYEGSAHSTSDIKAAAAAAGYDMYEAKVTTSGQISTYATGDATTISYTSGGTTLRRDLVFKQMAANKFFYLPRGSSIPNMEYSGTNVTATGFVQNWAYHDFFGGYLSNQYTVQGTNFNKWIPFQTWLADDQLLYTTRYVMQLNVLQNVSSLSVEGGPQFVQSSGGRYFEEQTEVDPATGESVQVIVVIGDDASGGADTDTDMTPNSQYQQQQQQQYQTIEENAINVTVNNSVSTTDVNEIWQAGGSGTVQQGLGEAIAYGRDAVGRFTGLISAALAFAPAWVQSSVALVLAIVPLLLLFRLLHLFL